VSAIDELLGRKSSVSGLENQDYGLGIRRAEHVSASGSGTPSLVHME
jgi:hypothetical protein